MLALLLLLLVVAVLVGGLGVFVAPLFFALFAVVLFLVVLSGGFYARRGRGRRWRTF